MKKLLFVFLILVTLAIDDVSGQNTFPASGNVGLGIASPTYPLHVRNAAASNRARFHFGVGVIDLATYSTGNFAYSNSSGMFVSHQDALVMAGGSKDIRFVTYIGQF